MKRLRTWLDNKVELRDDRGSAILFVWDAEIDDDIDGDDDNAMDERFRSAADSGQRWFNTGYHVAKAERSESTRASPTDEEPESVFRLRNVWTKQFWLGVGGAALFVAWLGLVVSVIFRVGNWVLKPFGLSRWISGPLGAALILMALIAFGWLAEFVPWSKRQREYSASRQRVERLRLGHCGTCGFTLDGVDVAPDKCRTCPECGAAWNLDGWAAS